MITTACHKFSIWWHRKKVGTLWAHTNISFFDNIAFSCTYIFNKNVIAGWINLLKKGAGTSTQQKSYIFLIIIFVQGLSFKKRCSSRSKCKSCRQGQWRQQRRVPESICGERTPLKMLSLCWENRGAGGIILCVFLKKSMQKEKKNIRRGSLFLLKNSSSCMCFSVSNACYASPFEMEVYKADKNRP